MAGEDAQAIIELPTTAVSAVVASLAILKVNADEGHDYIDGFVPFAAECLRAAVQPEVSVAELDACMRTQFGFNVPLPTLVTVLQRASRDGLVRIDHGVYHRTDRLEEASAIPQVRANALRQIRALSDALVLYAETHHGFTWSQEQAESALFVHLQQQAVPLLAAAIQGVPIVASGTSLVKSADYVVSAFVLELSETDPVKFGYVETFVKGAMLASVLFFPELGQAERRFEHVDAFFDTPVLLRAIGAHGPVAEKAAQQTVDLAYGLGIRPLCFRSTFDETLGVLKSAAKSLRRHGVYSLNPSETVEYLLEAGYVASDIDFMIARLGRVLRSLHIEIAERPAQTKELVVDEPQFEKVLQDEVHYFRPEALKHDLDALTAIHRLRGGDVSRSFETTRAIFVTTNISLVRAARRFFAEHYGTNGVPICFADHHFGTLMWLKKPLAAPDLPRDLLLASCYAALNPPDALWQKYLAEIDKLRTRGDLTEEDYYLLRFDLGSRSSLLTLTEGRHEAFVEGTVPEILRRARANATRETEAKLHAETARAQSAEDAEQMAIRRADHDKADRDLRYRLIGNRCGLIVRWVVLSIGVVVGIVLAAVGFFVLSNWLFVALAVASILTSAAGVFDWTVGRWFRERAMAAESGVSTAVHDWLSELFEAKDDPPSAQ